jgi:hypothetical protein
MCMYSVIADHFIDKWTQPGGPLIPGIVKPSTTPMGPFQPLVNPDWEKDERIRKLEEEVAEMKKLLKRAKVYDEEHDHAECETDTKVYKLKAVAELVGESLEHEDYHPVKKGG